MVLFQYQEFGLQNKLKHLKISFKLIKRRSLRSMRHVIIGTGPAGVTAAGWHRSGSNRTGGWLSTCRSARARVTQCADPHTLQRSMRSSRPIGRRGRGSPAQPLTRKNVPSCRRWRCGLFMLVCHDIGRQPVRASGAEGQGR